MQQKREGENALGVFDRIITVNGEEASTLAASTAKMIRDAPAGVVRLVVRRCHPSLHGAARCLQSAWRRSEKIYMVKATGRG